MLVWLRYLPPGVFTCFSSVVYVGPLGLVSVAALCSLVCCYMQLCMLFLVLPLKGVLLEVGWNWVQLLAACLLDYVLTIYCLVVCLLLDTTLNPLVGVVATICRLLMMCCWPSWGWSCYLLQSAPVSLLVMAGWPGLPCW